MSRRECETCPELLPEHGTSPFCTKCRSGRRYWSKKRPAQRLKRRADLVIYAARLETFHDDTKGSKVIQAQHKFARPSAPASNTERARRQA